MSSISPNSRGIEYILRRLGRDESLVVLSGSKGSDLRGRAFGSTKAKSADKTVPKGSRTGLLDETLRDKHLT